MATFVMETANDPGLIGQTVDCFAIGAAPSGWPLFIGDSLGTSDVGYDITINFSQLQFISHGLGYLPGDANMILGVWQPQVIGSDVTYLVAYFRGINPPCLLGDPGIFCAADVNGDCSVIGSDVTKMVSYFRGLTQLQYCPDYEPLWPTPDDLPVEMPAGWPGCGE
jgi:hypothetical protein